MEDHTSRYFRGEGGVIEGEEGEKCDFERGTEGGIRERDGATGEAEEGEAKGEDPVLRVKTIRHAMSGSNNVHSSTSMRWARNIYVCSIGGHRNPCYTMIF